MEVGRGLAVFHFEEQAEPAGRHSALPCEIAASLEAPRNDRKEGLLATLDYWPDSLSF